METDNMATTTQQQQQQMTTYYATGYCAAHTPEHLTDEWRRTQLHWARMAGSREVAGEMAERPWRAEMHDRPYGGTRLALAWVTDDGLAEIAWTRDANGQHREAVRAGTLHAGLAWVEARLGNLHVPGADHMEYPWHVR
jgi:hypothetical protein